MCFNATEKYEKVESVNTQNDYKTTSKKWRDNKENRLFLCVLYLNVFKFQESKIRIVQKNF